MDPVTVMAVITLIGEGLKTFNMVYANEPPEQLKAQGLITWNMAKPILRLVLTEEIKAELKKNGIEI